MLHTATTMLFNLGKPFPSELSQQGRGMLELLSMAGAEGEQTWLGPGWNTRWKEARQTLFIHFLACNEMAGAQQLHAGPFVVMYELLGI